MDDSLCGKGLTRHVGTAGLQVYNITTQRQIYDLFNKKIAEYPAFAADTAVIMEGYSIENVRNKDPKASAYPLRDDYLLMCVCLCFLPTFKSSSNT